MTLPKRLFDLAIALVLSLLLLPVFLIVAALILIKDGHPILYVSERMKSLDTGFNLFKFRTMKPSKEDTGVSGGDKGDRITKYGYAFRRTRLDELPQLWNVLKGDISFVGPRPPLRQYVEQFPEIYGPVLRSRPGITGLASLKFHAHEERLLANTKTVAETDNVYKRICIPRKAALDIIYQKNQTLCFDLYIMIITVFK
jgi:lipopolysaccharide/colanic/teichoic acid biosynthesis glycosyltransferase